MRTTCISVAILLISAVGVACAAQNDKQAETLYNYKWQVDASWWFSSPSGHFTGANNSGTIDLNRDLGFHSYSTFTGYADWRFKPKHHLGLRINPIKNDQTKILTGQIEFQGVTYNIGTQIEGQIRSLSFTPGYQYDFLRRRQGYLGGRVEMTLIDTKVSLAGMTTVNGASSSRSVSGQVFNVMPILGPQGRWYPIHDSNRIALDGSVMGMYFFGYGDFLSTRGFITYQFHPHWSITAGYQMGNRLSVHGNSSRIGVRLTQKGPIAGFEATW